MDAATPVKLTALYSTVVTSKSSYRRACDVWCGQMDPCWSRHATQLCKKGRDEAVEFCVEVPRMPLCQRSPTTCKIYQHPLL